MPLLVAVCSREKESKTCAWKSFEMLQQLTKSMSKGRFRGIPGMGGMPGMGGRGKMQGFGRKKRLK